jgi:hypothetical protein
MAVDQIEQTNNGTRAPSRTQRPSRWSAEKLATRGRLVIGWALILAAIVLLSIGWYGVSGTPQVARQLSYLVSGGIGGLLAGIVGIGLLVSLDVRRDRERLGRVEAGMLEVREMLVAQAELLKRLGLDAPDAAGQPVPEESRSRSRSAE